MLYLLWYESRILNIITIWSFRDLVFLSHCALFHWWLWCRRLRIYTLHNLHVNKHKSNVGQGNVGENKIIWNYLVKLLYRKVTCLFIAKYIHFMTCDRITHILPEFPHKEKKISEDVCARKIIKHRWQVKIEKSQTLSGKISRSSLVRERLKSYPWVSEISRSWPATGVRFY